MAQASVPTDLVHNVMEPVPHKFGDSSHGGGGDSQTQVLVELLRQVSPLSSEELEPILWLSVRLEEVHDLGLADDRVFVTRILPLVSGSLLTFLGDCLRKGGRWAECKARLLDEYSPYFVRERLIRDLIHLAHSCCRLTNDRAVNTAEICIKGGQLRPQGIHSSAATRRQSKIASIKKEIVGLLASRRNSRACHLKRASPDLPRQESIAGPVPRGVIAVCTTKGDVCLRHQRE